MIAIAIDDEPVALQVIEHHIAKVSFIELKSTFTDAFMAIDYLQKEQVDLIFLDIKMPDISSIEFLRSLNTSPMVIFTTAYSEHALLSFELDAIDYLLKPFSMSRFLKACNKVSELYSLRAKKLQHNKDYLFVKDGYEHVKVEIDRIQYIEASGNYTQIHLGDKCVSSRITISELLELLPKNEFVRCHRAFIVARSKMIKFDKTQIWVADRVIPIGTTYTELKLY
ncbi:LytTR family DNA-binding domain-containing protein [Sphingobacterium sp. 18053]|uniref:LytR/AlgR family response regulator transcription factor n=1 Tax=Sphingobacterium sp. 18053 TaxID=2681401 RepID=UPI00135A3094|nr:LytTR family DNA-binding domain-containing protein [Sphingobacterium sp. 18053]